MHEGNPLSKVADQEGGLSQSYEKPGVGRRHLVESGFLSRICKGEALSHSCPRWSCKQGILNYYHCALAGRHRGAIKTYWRVKERFYWPGLHKDIYEFFTLCEKCQRTERDKPPKQANLKTITPTRRFEQAAMDILKLNKTHRGNIYLLFIRDMFTKFTWAVPMPCMTTEAIAKAFFDYWLSVFGTPDKLLMDQGSPFTSELSLILCRIIGIKKVFTTP